MNPQKNIRWAIIGIGEIGETHARNLLTGQVARAELTAVLHPDSKRWEKFPTAKGFANLQDLVSANIADALLIATPQSSHLELGREALAAGLHVLMEKPLARSHAEAVQLLEAPCAPNQQFGLMLNQRLDPAYGALRSAIHSGMIGRLQRVAWTATDWFRTQCYYDDRPWRGTWEGEGGGVLITQGLHHLDLYCWIFGLPNYVSGHCGWGRYHRMETEDDVTAYMEHADGMHSTFITTTGEAPGMNRVEVIGEGGRLILENNILRCWKNETSSAEVLRLGTSWFDAPKSEESMVPTDQGPARCKVWGGQHAEMLENFTDAILDGTPLVAHASEGLKALQIVNAIQSSSRKPSTGLEIAKPADG